ncbi:MAG: FtsW/RodA/SpoVE family cell cycle protein [Kiritimatiellae bacterium]|nr:FtsW/RodA/SpoVE family cell cycle protein [Kiritimatiellia bacterium]
MFAFVVLLPLAVFLPLHLSVIAVRLANAPALGWPELAPAALFTVVLLVVWAELAFSRYSGSPALPCAAMALLGVGIAVQYRIGTFRTVELQSPSQAALPLGVVAMLAAHLAFRRGRLGVLERFWAVFLGLAVAVVAGVIVAGRAFRGAIYLPGGMNPVEIVKPLLVLFVAALLSGHRKLLRRGFLGIPLPPLNIIVTVALFWAPPVLLLVAQGDLGMFALSNAVLLVMLAATTGRSLYMTGGLAALVAAARFAIPLTARGRARLAAWQDPFSVAMKNGWQPLQALVALYSGGIWGTGFGAGSPRAVPIVESDFAYVIIGEELGLAGCIAIAALYAVVVFSGMRIAARARNAYASCVAVGLSASLGLQTLLNIGGCSKAIPLTGIPLPFLSHGGSSLATTLLMVGLLLAVSDEDPPLEARRYATAGAGTRA